MLFEEKVYKIQEKFQLIVGIVNSYELAQAKGTTLVNNEAHFILGAFELRAGPNSSNFN